MYKQAVILLLMLFTASVSAALPARYMQTIENAAVWAQIGDKMVTVGNGFAPIFPDTCYHLTHYWPAAADIPVASDNPVHYADAIRYNARTPLQGSLLPLTRLV